jgi:hypothetical protein
VIIVGLVSRSGRVKTNSCRILFLKPFISDSFERGRDMLGNIDACPRSRCDIIQRLRNVRQGVLHFFVALEHKSGLGLIF